MASESSSVSSGAAGEGVHRKCAERQEECGNDANIPNTAKEPGSEGSDKNSEYAVICS